MTSEWQPMALARGLIGPNDRKIYVHHDGRCSISEHDVWVPGVYADVETAKVAFGFEDAQLQALQDAVNEREKDDGRRYLTLDALNALKEQA